MPNPPQWKTPVFLRDRRRCVKCNSSDNATAQHIKSPITYPHLEKVAANMITLCQKHAIELQGDEEAKQALYDEKYLQD